MCYHYSLDQLKDYEDIEGFDPYYHVSGFNYPKMPVVLNDGKVHLLHWGLVPHWVSDKQKLGEIRSNTLNARCETAVEKPSFRNAFKLGRFCVVLSNGFYEWMEFKGKNYPHFIYLKDRPIFGMAGIWDIWVDRETGEEIKSFAILTCDANEIMARIHNKKKRMPVILEKEDEKRWLQEGAKELLIPYPTSKMDAHTISKLITSRTETSNQPAVSKKFDYPELTPSLGLF